MLAHKKRTKLKKIETEQAGGVKLENSTPSIGGGSSGGGVKDKNLTPRYTSFALWLKYSEGVSIEGWKGVQGGYS